MKYVPYGELIQLRPCNCPKYLSCKAPIFPLDPGWFKRTYLKGESVCFYMLEAQKSRAKSRLKETVEQEIHRAVCIVIADVKCIYGPLGKRLDRARRTPSRRSC